jgi:hypothetical protein
MTGLHYKENVETTIERLTALWARESPDRILATIEVPTPAVAEFGAEHADGFCDYPDPAARAAFWDRYLAERRPVHDDGMPSAYLSEFDQGLYGGLVGGEVQFMCHPDKGWISSMVAPLLDNWSEFDELTLDPEHPWFQRYVQQLAIYRREAAGKFGVSHFILIDGLNFVFELLGATETYNSLFTAPERVRQAIEFAYRLNRWVQDTFFERIPCFQGGTYSNMVQWIPGRIVSESVDPFHMTSVDYFERWGREPVERILDDYDGGVLHIHGNGRHLLEAVTTVRGLKAIYVLDDRGYPLAIDVARELRERAGDVPLVIKAEYGDFMEKLEAHALPGGVLYKVADAPNVDAANRCWKRVRGYRARS